MWTPGAPLKENSVSNLPEIIKSMIEPYIPSGEYAFFCGYASAKSKGWALVLTGNKLLLLEASREEIASTTGSKENSELHSIITITKLSEIHSLKEEQEGEKWTLSFYDDSEEYQQFLSDQFKDKYLYFKFREEFVRKVSSA